MREYPRQKIQVTGDTSGCLLHNRSSLPCPLSPSPSPYLGEPSRRKVRVGSLSSCSSWSEPRAHTCTPCFQKAWSCPLTKAGRKAVPVTLGYHLSLHLGPWALPSLHVPTASTASVIGISEVRRPRTGVPSRVTSFRDPRRG